jgi:hypothetical protein
VLSVGLLSSPRENFFASFKRLCFRMRDEKMNRRVAAFRARAADFPANVAVCGMAPSLRRGGLVRLPSDL